MLPTAAELARAFVSRTLALEEHFMSQKTDELVAAYNALAAAVPAAVAHIGAKQAELAATQADNETIDAVVAGIREQVASLAPYIPAPAE